MSKRILVALGAVVLLLALASSAVFAEGPGDRPAPKVSHNPLLGIVPTHGEAASRLRTNGGNLTYHNGPVMHTNTTYAIYWILAGFSVSTNYESLINGFFQNVSADNGKTSNVYYSDTQYYDNVNGKIFYSSSLGGFVVDTNPFPANGCSDSYTSVCLSDAQIQVEIQNVMNAQGWIGGESHLFFMFTPKNVGSCAGSS